MHPKPIETPRAPRSLSIPQQAARGLSGFPWLLRSAIVAAATYSLAAGAAQWSTTSHMGYAMSRESSTGFEKVGGSMAYFDLARSLPGSVDAGLRTLAQGGRSDSLEFYRLGSGPFIGWSPAAGWRLETGVAFFRESGLAPDGGRIYKSQGRAWILGWERSQALFPKVDLAYGGLLMAHRGELSLEDGPSAASLSRLSRQRNDGLSQGVQLALRIRLD